MGALSRLLFSVGLVGLLVPEKKQLVRTVQGKHVASSGAYINSLRRIDRWIETDRGPTAFSRNDSDAAHATGRSFFSDTLQSLRIFQTLRTQSNKQRRYSPWHTAGRTSGDPEPG